MNYQLITKSLELARRPVGGYKPRITRDNLEGYGAPVGFVYVEDLPKPDAIDGKRIARKSPTLEAWGWEHTDLTPEEIEAQKPHVPTIEKRVLIERLEAIGKRNDFKLFLKTLDDLDQDIWDSVHSIKSDDPFIVKNLPAFMAGFGMTESQVIEILTP